MSVGYIASGGLYLKWSAGHIACGEQYSIPVVSVMLCKWAVPFIANFESELMTLFCVI